MKRGPKKGHRHAGMFRAGDPRINRAGTTTDAAAAARELRAAAAILTTPDRGGRTKLAAILERLTALALAGDVRAAELLFDRLAGRAIQPLAVDAIEHVAFTLGDLPRRHPGATNKTAKNSGQ